MTETPIALIIFNRPNLTRYVFNEIRKAKPKELFVISDAPREEKGNEEKELVQKAREIAEQVDWKCKVYKRFATQNLGCRKNVSSGLDWVFSRVEDAIILEDDCAPDQTFFQFCAGLIEKYRNNKAVMMVSGNNHQGNEMNYSYGFCRHSLIWGWATWKRAWITYRDAEKQGLKELSSNYGSYSKIMSPIRLNAIKKTLEGKIDTWDYIWQMAMLLNNGLCIYPSVNLVKNEGFGKDATHTKFATYQSRINAHSISFPLKHPPEIRPDITFDKVLEKTYRPVNMLWDIVAGAILRKNRQD